jgi:hypothetical protein
MEFCKCIWQNNATKEGNNSSSRAWPVRLAFADNPADSPLTDDRNTTTTQPQDCNGVKRQQQINKDESASSKRRQKNGRGDQHDAQSPLDDHRAILSSPVTRDK